MWHDHTSMCVRILCKFLVFCTACMQLSIVFSQYLWYTVLNEYSTANNITVTILITTVIILKIIASTKCDVELFIKCLYHVYANPVVCIWSFCFMVFNVFLTKWSKYSTCISKPQPFLLDILDLLWMFAVFVMQVLQYVSKKNFVLFYILLPTNFRVLGIFQLFHYLWLILSTL